MFFEFIENKNKLKSRKVLLCWPLVLEWIGYESLLKASIIETQIESGHCFVRILIRTMCNPSNETESFPI